MTGADGRFATIEGMSRISNRFSNYYDMTGADGKFATLQGMSGVNARFDNYYNKNTIKSILNISVPIGTIIVYAGSTLPTGFLWCDGSEYEKTTYQKLFNAISTTYGSTTSTTKFRVPNIKSKTIIGVDGTNKPLGATGGVETVTVSSTGALTSANMPIHSHTGTTVSGGGIHSHTTVSDPDGAHNHGIGNGTTKLNNYDTGNGDIPTTSQYSGKISTDNVNPHTHQIKIVDTGAHTHTLTIYNTGNTNPSSFTTTSGNVSVMQPYIVLNYIIKYDDIDPVIVAENYTYISSPYFGVF